MNKKQLSTVYGFMGTQAEILKTRLDCDVLYAKVIIESNELSYLGIDRTVNQALDAMLDDIHKYTKNSSFKQIVNIFKRDEDERFSKADHDYIEQSIKHITNVAECLFDTYVTLSTR